MLHTDLAESVPLFVGSTHILVENVETSEMAREWTRQQMAEAAARMSPMARQTVDLPPRAGQIAPALHTPLSA
ncbi:MAG TPA: hypothetical protein VGI81_03510 [Tepidisphaeraceae bacterium]|jgi:hypothetical protein